MKLLLTITALFVTTQFCSTQTLYFPPLAGSTWETLPPDSLGWCSDRIDSLYQYLEEKNTKAFLVLKNGRIVLEKYFGSFVQDSVWYWASAGKSATAALVGIAQQEGLLDLDEPSSNYLGLGWSSAPPEKEALITIRHHLTMTTGLNDNVPDVDCTLDTCLLYLADAGTRWAYHNAPYTLLDKVVIAATGQNYNLYFNSKIRSKTGMKGLWLPVGYNNVYFSDARSMARFGLLIQNGGYWDNTPLLTDTAYLNAMLNTSQPLNKSYGYLWWLNGKDSYMVPGLQFAFNGPLNPDAPPDVVAALGKNGQFLNVSKNDGLIIVRMGNSPEGDLPVPFLLNNEIWKRINGLFCTVTSAEEFAVQENVHLFPNPAVDFVSVQMPAGIADFTLVITDPLGRRVFTEKNMTRVNIAGWLPGTYTFFVKWEGGVALRRVVKL